MNQQASLSQSQTLWPLLTVNFIGTMGYSLVLPFLIFMVQDFGGNEITYGILISVYPTFQMIGAPLLGSWSDRYGRKRILVLSQAGTFLAWGLFWAALLSPKTLLWGRELTTLGSFTLTLPLLILFLARALDGLTGGNVSVANAYLSDISNDANRQVNYGKMAMSSSLGFIIGPALSGILGATSWGNLLPIIVAAGISLLAIFLIQILLPETVCQTVPVHRLRFSLRKLFSFEQKECYEQEEKKKPLQLQNLLKIPGIPRMLLVYFVTFLAFSFFYASFPPFAAGTMGWGSLQLGLFFTFLSAAMILVQGPVLNLASQKFSEIQLIRLGCVLLSLNFLFLMTATFPGAIASLLLYALGNGLMWPSYLSILSKTGDRSQQGSIQGIANSAGSLASIFGMLLGGVLYSLIQSYVFVTSAFFIALVLFIMQDPKANLKTSINDPLE